MLMKISLLLRKTLLLRLITLLALVSLGTPARAQQDPVEQKIEQILSQMTLNEKLDYVTGYGVDFTFQRLKGVFNIRPVERLGLPLIYGSDGGIGLVGQGFPPGTRFPAGPLLVSTWNPDLAYEAGVAHGREASARGIHRVLVPGMNFYRTAFGGRSFEYLTGEDPFLAATTVPTVVKGIQSNRVMVTTKHFALNDQEVNRTFINNVADERTLRKIYLPPFEAAVKLGNTAAVMSAFNAINGDFAPESKFLITEVARLGLPGIRRIGLPGHSRWGKGRPGRYGYRHAGLR
jgi:beta-glucosidase